jgi:hypothetical protein
MLHTLTLFFLWSPGRNIAHEPMQADSIGRDLALV